MITFIFQSPILCKNMKLTDVKVRQFIFLNLYLLAIYFLVFLNLKTSVNYFILFSSPDSQDYHEVGNWIFENRFTDQTLNNPVLYPFLLKLLLILFDVEGVWFVQFLFWVTSINFLFYAIWRITNKHFAYIGAVILSLNLSYIALTLHALTDVTVTFLICWMIFYLSKRVDGFRKINIFYIVLLFFSILTIIKPVFYPALLILLIVVFPLYYFKDFLRSRRKYLLIAVLLPVIFQMCLMLIKHNTLSLSTKGAVTFKLYFYAQSYAEVNNMSVEEAMVVVRNEPQGSMIPFLLDNKILIVKKFWENIFFENITGKPTFLDFPPGYRSKIFYYVMQLENWFFLLLHFLFFIPGLYLLFNLWKTKSPMLGFYSFLLLLFYYLVLITGIAFWQGDRYTVSFQPFWIIIYLYVIFQFNSFHKTKREIS